MASITASPNPFNPSVFIRLDRSQLKEKDKVKMMVFDVRGKMIKDLTVQFEHTDHAIWNAETMASGIYLLRMQAGQQSFIRKITLIR
ncbi:MAG: hypothetical protein A2293_03045 [Elusimicrobia bacterium RIFOXYB2_FULL_49_7]|nr:MAG: hypothetical protein A2293_03045 [Elusimicrobia bacterium RIFOXYB2_FULL_49_7]